MATVSGVAETSLETRWFVGIPDSRSLGHIDLDDWEVAARQWIEIGQQEHHITVWQLRSRVRIQAQAVLVLPICSIDWAFTSNPHNTWLCTRYQMCAASSLCTWWRERVHMPEGHTSRHRKVHKKGCCGDIALCSTIRPIGCDLESGGHLVRARLHEAGLDRSLKFRYAFRSGSGQSVRRGPRLPG